MSDHRSTEDSRPVRTGVLVTVAGLVTLAACGLVVRNGTVGPVERSVFRAVNGLPGWLYRPMWVFEQVGNLAVAFVLVLLVAAVFRRPKLAAAGALAVIAKLGLERVVKSVVERGRPGSTVGDVVLRGQVPAHGLSFVSGHAAITVALATALTAVLPRRWRPVPWVLVVLNGVARVYVGAHNPLDVVGGAALGLVIGGPLYAWLAMARRPAGASGLLSRIVGRRHPGDVLRVVLGLAVLFATALFVHHDRVGVVEIDVFRLVNDLPLPGWTWPAVWLVMQFGNFGAIPVTAVAAGVTRRWRMALDFTVAGGTIYLLAKVVKALVERGRPQTLLDSVHILGEPAQGLGYVSGHSALAVALATVAAPYLGRRARRGVWAVAVLVCLFRVYVGAHLPLDVVGGMALGWVAGATAHLVLGGPEGHVPVSRLRRALGRRGIVALDVQPVSTPTRRSATFRVTPAAGPDLFVKVMARERRDDDLLYRAWRAMTRRRLGGAPHVSASSQVEREAYVAQLAAAIGARVPPVVFAGAFGNGAGLLVQRWVPGAQLGQLGAPIDPALAGAVRDQVSVLHRAGIAHRDLQATSILVDEAGQPWLIDFSHAETGADQAALAQDLVDVQVTLVALADPAPALQLV